MPTIGLTHPASVLKIFPLRIPGRFVCVESSRQLMYNPSVAELAGGFPYNPDYISAERRWNGFAPTMSLSFD
jgi:hypothetical protein